MPSSTTRLYGQSLLLGITFKVAKGIKDVSSRILIAKITRFVNEPALQSSKVKQRLKDKALSAPPESEKIGESLFLVLERLTAFSKADLLAKCFAAYIDNAISALDLRRLGCAIDLAFEDDLESLLEILPHRNLSWAGNRLTSGLAYPKPLMTQKIDSEIESEVSRLGHLLRKAVHHANSIVEIEKSREKRANTFTTE